MENISFASLVNKTSIFGFVFKIFPMFQFDPKSSLKILILRILISKIIFTLYCAQHQESSLKRILWKMSTAVTDNNTSHNNTNVGK